MSRAAPSHLQVGSKPVPVEAWTGCLLQGEVAEVQEPRKSMSHLSRLVAESSGCTHAPLSAASDGFPAQADEPHPMSAFAHPLQHAGGGAGYEAQHPLEEADGADQGASRVITLHGTWLSLCISHVCSME